MTVLTPEKITPMADAETEGLVDVLLEIARERKRPPSHLCAKMMATLVAGNRRELNRLAKTGEILSPASLDAELRSLWESLPPVYRPWIQGLTDYYSHRVGDFGPVKGWRSLTWK